MGLLQSVSGERRIRLGWGASDGKTRIGGRWNIELVPARNNEITLHTVQYYSTVCRKECCFLA